MRDQDRGEKARAAHHCLIDDRQAVRPDRQRLDARRHPPGKVRARHGRSTLVETGTEPRGDPLQALPKTLPRRNRAAPLGQDCTFAKRAA